MTEGEAEKRRSSAEIVAVSTEMKQRLDEKKSKRKTKKSKQDEKDDLDDAKRELEMDEHKRDLDELVADMASDKDAGMTSENAEKRRQTEGLNMLTPPKKVPEWLKLLHEMTGFFSILLWIGAILCFVGYGLRSEVDNLYLGVVLTIVVLLTGLFSYFQNRKSSNLMESFKSMMPTMTTVIRDGKSQKIDAMYLVRGDVIELKGGDKVPADIRVIKCSDDTQVDNACLTGESEPQKRVPECTDDNPLETKNLCFFGTFVPQGNCTGLVVNIGDKTVMGRIAKLATATNTEKTPIAVEIEHFVHIVSGVAIFLGVTFFIIGVAIGTDIITNLVFMIGIIVANVPEGLLATVTVCLTLTAKRMSTKSVLVKNLEGVETLGSTTCICSDKTGTLTQNVMTVTNIVYDNKIWDAECSITPKGNYNLNDVSFQRLQRCATLCNNAVFDEESKFEKVVTGTGENIKIIRGDPIPFKQMLTMGDGSQMEKVMWEPIGDASESAMIKFCQDKRNITEYRAENEKIKEIPFNSRNKYQVSLHRQDNDTSKDILLVMKGAPERITARCSHVLLDGKVVDMTPQRLAEIESCQLQLSKKGMRVLGFCEKLLDKKAYPADYKFDTDNPNFPLGEKNVDYNSTPVPHKNVEEGLCFLGLMALIDPPRPQVPPAVAKCKTAGIKVIMVTGDHPITAKAIAHKVGILWGPTKEDIEEENKEAGLERGQPGWQDPDEAPAIVVPGWTISLDTPVEEWDRILDHPQIVFARTSPQQKLIIVENNQRRNEIVAVTGDGVNDSPALKKADIGVAMGIMGSEVSKEAADMILLDDNFASIVAGVEEGRLIFDNLKKSIAYTLSSNIPEISPFLLFIVLQIPLPLSTVLILAVDLGTDMVPAISMAYEKAESDIMMRAPRNAQVDRLVTKKLVSFAYLQIGVIQAAAGFFTYMVVLNDYGYPPHILPGLGLADNWGKQVLWCKFDGGQFCTVGGKKRVGSNNEDIGTITGRSCQANYDIAPSSGNPYDAHIFWDPRSDGRIVDCQFALQNFEGSKEKPAAFDRFTRSTYQTYTKGKVEVTLQSMEAAVEAGYFPYYPLKSRSSAFFDYNWLKWDVSDENVPGLGSDVADEIFFAYQPLFTWGISDKSALDSDDVNAPGAAKDAFSGQVVNLTQLSSDGTFNNSISEAATFTLERDTLYSEATMGLMDLCEGDLCLLDYRNGFGTSTDGTSEGRGDKASRINVMSRMMQREALSFAQGAFFVTIVVVQWADLMICKTRMLSIRQQGMKNAVMNFGLMFETILAAYLCYIYEINRALGTRNLRFTHWFPGMPFSIFIFLYDETRKFLMRSTSRIRIDEETGRVIRHPGWLEYNTYY